MRLLPWEEERLRARVPRSATDDTNVTETVGAAVGTRRLGTRRRFVPISGVRGLTRASLAWNRAAPAIDIDVRSGEVSLAGRRLAVETVSEVPLSRCYLLR